jgi:hypothetical protein
MLIEHRQSHLTQHKVLFFLSTTPFKTQVKAKGFEARVFEFRAIVTADRL